MRNQSFLGPPWGPPCVGHLGTWPAVSRDVRTVPQLPESVTSGSRLLRHVKVSWGALGTWGAHASPWAERSRSAQVGPGVCQSGGSAREAPSQWNGPQTAVGCPPRPGTSTARALLSLIKGEGVRSS